MIKLLGVDLKRLLQSRAMLLFALAAPIALVLLVSLAVAPYFYANVRTQPFTVAVWNEDDDAMTQTLLNGLVESRSLAGLIRTEFVDSEEEGLAAVENGAAAYVHIPKGMQDTLASGGRSVIEYTGNPNMPLEDALLFETLDSGMGLVSHAQHAANVLYWDSLDAGLSQETAVAAYNSAARAYFSGVLMRSALFEDTEETSPLGGALPVQYYAASFLVLFVALGGLPVARITADDTAGGLVHRQLLSGHAPGACFVSRWLAGAALLLMQYAVLAAALGLMVGFAGGLPALLLGGVLLSLFLSLCMVTAGLGSKTSATAVRAAFLMMLALALLGGLLVPSAYMPGVIREISYYSPLSAGLRLVIGGLFDASAGGTWMFAGILAVFTAVLLPLGIIRFQRSVQ
ncbi:MAG: ABC transporter permease [Christensenellaceae bacterium]|nr:ABC transporter permease [Christensenellaceae bacterium]